jgi:hypothetical protein
MSTIYWSLTSAREVGGISILLSERFLLAGALCLLDPLKLNRILRPPAGPLNRGVRPSWVEVARAAHHPIFSARLEETEWTMLLSSRMTGIS